MSADPTHFQENLRIRAFPYRYRKIGTPQAYLDDIGLMAIMEFLYKGFTIIDAAEEMDVPVTHLLRWIEHNGYQDDIDEAYKLGAQGYLSRARRKVENATHDIDFKKAKLLLSHAHYVASKHDRKKYGEASAAGPSTGGGGIQYVFNIGAEAAQQPQTLKMVNDVAAAPLQHLGGDQNPHAADAPIEETSQAGDGPEFASEELVDPAVELGLGPFTMDPDSISEDTMPAYLRDDKDE